MRPGTKPGAAITSSARLAGYVDADRCDPIDPSVCLYPWPNDEFTKPDPTLATGRRLDLNPLSMPRNVIGKPIDPTDQNRNDGFSPGNLIVTRVPGLETPAAFARNRLVPITDMARYADPDQAAVVIDTTTHQRWPIWSELDANPAKATDVTLILRPARNFTEGHRYVVALRHLRDANGAPIGARDAFRFFRDRIATSPRIDAFEARRSRMERIFGDLAQAGIARDDLYLAWDFTVASERNLSERVLAARDDALKQLGDSTPGDFVPQGAGPQVVLNPDLPDDVATAIPQAAVADGVRDFTPAQDPLIARQVRGQLIVPCYLNLPGCPPGARFAYPSTTATKPSWIAGNQMAMNFICNIPRIAATAPQRPGLYGHGLLGSAEEVNQGQLKRLSQNYGFTFCATDWVGMSTTDLPNVATLLTDLSQFSSLTDRVQQALVNQTMLGRAELKSFNALPAFKMGGHGVFDTSAGRVYYDGNSQGGIIGGAFAAVTPDADRAVIGVLGMNYSTLLQRSSDFATYSQLLYQAYPNELERPLVLSLIQLLWDRAEANGYAAHMGVDPLPGTPAHRVLMHMAFGDHQVANVAAEVEARTAGASTTPQPLNAGRSPDVMALWGIPRITSFPFGGPAVLQVFDSGTPAPPTQDVPPPKTTHDPHEDPRNSVPAMRQKDAFLRPGGQVVDVCGGPCHIPQQ